MVHFKGKMIVTLVFAMMVITSVGFVHHGVTANEAVETKKDFPNVVVIFSSKNGEIDEHQRMLAMLLGHFTDHLLFRSSKDLVENDLAEVDYLFYFGQQRDILSPSVVKLMSDFTGTMVAIGQNIEQLGERFDFVEQVSNTAVIDRISSAHQPDKHFTFTPQYILNIMLKEDAHVETILTGMKDNMNYPLLIKNRNNYYFASNLLRFPFSIAFAEGLHEIFEEVVLEQGEHRKHFGYLRLEDIHPLVNPSNVMSIAQILKEKKIPYMIAVIPVYTNPETGKQYHFSDSPKLLKALKYMQEHGGSIILHGYTHQFRLSETGEGFEFWDVEYNMPIYHHQDAPVVIKTREDFLSDEEYEHFHNQQKAFEKKYIEERIIRGIEELVNYGLYPLAFEAPHYTMSQHGYQVISNYFSTYSGQVQISDEDWEIMTTAPYITKPTFMHGMLLLPETMGYIKPEEPQAINQMLDHAQDYQFVRDGMLAGFYHPYLGVELFTELIGKLEQLDVEWIDLKQLNNTVRTDHVEVTSEGGQVFVEMEKMDLYMESPHFLIYHIKLLIEKISWGFACIGLMAVVLFIINIFKIRQRNKNMEWGDQVG